MFTNPHTSLQIQESTAQRAIDAKLPLLHETEPAKYRVTSATVAFAEGSLAMKGAHWQLFGPDLTKSLCTFPGDPSEAGTVSTGAAPLAKNTVRASSSASRIKLSR